MKPILRSCVLLCLIVFSSGCVSTVIGMTADAAVAVTKVAVTAPIKVGAAAVDAATDDDDD